MAYYIYRINHGPTSLVKNLQLLEDFPSFKEAQERAKQLRAELDSGANATIKVIFADNELQAEELLHERREQPILREWEK